MLEDVIALASLTALIMFSPGPDLLLVARNTISGGATAGRMTAAGILSGNLVHITYCLLGIGWLVANSIAAFTTLKYLGGLYLLYLGFRTLQATTHTIEQTAESLGPASTLEHCWIQGFLNNLLNPKGALFYLGVFGVLIRPDESSVSTVAILVLTMILVSTTFWVIFIHVLCLRGTQTFSERGARFVNRFLGAALIGLGIRLFMAHGPEES